MTASTIDKTQRGSRTTAPNRLFHFLTELRRRRVCRAVSMYAVAMWLMCQIVDVISPALGLPDWTLKLVIVLGLLGLPIIVIMSWILEITPDGLIIDNSRDFESGSAAITGHSKIVDRIIDCSLILAALAIGTQLAIGAVGNESLAAGTSSHRISVMPFRAAGGDMATGLSNSITIELQHELSRQLGITVIAASNPDRLKGSMSLTGAASTNQTSMRVAVTLVDFDSGVIAWSDVFERPRADSLAAPAEIARDIVAALSAENLVPVPLRLADATR